MEQLPAGTVIETTAGLPVTVKRYLAGGGQGHVYIVDFKGEEKVLKWYKPGVFENEDDFYNNLLNNARKGSPDPAFLWPIVVTKKQDGSFGYVMDYKPDGYEEFAEFLMAHVFFSSYKAAAEACIRIVSAFRILHNRGYSYQDLNSGNFFIDPKTGDIRICDNDNVAPNGTKTFILGTPRFMAPEIVLGKALPSTQTDRYSLAVVLFMMLFFNHPLEGKNWVMNACLTPKTEMALYGSKALFLYDPDDDSNRPSPICNKNVIQRWQYMPGYLKDAFTRAFSQKAIKEPMMRLKERDWLKLLIRFRNDIVTCTTCGSEVFMQDIRGTYCDRCSNLVTVDHAIHMSDVSMPDYMVPIVKGAQLYRCQMGICNDDEALDPVIRIVSKVSDPRICGLRNETDQILEAWTPSNNKKFVKPGEVIPVKKGIRVNAYGGTMEIE